MIYIVTNQSQLFDQRFETATVTDVLNYFANRDYISMDSETQGFKCQDGNMLILQLGDPQNQYVIDVTTINIQHFKRLLESKVLIIQNAKFDLQWLYKYGIVPREVFDTYLAEAVLSTGLNQFVRKDFGTLVHRYCNVELDKSVVKHIEREGLTTRVIQYSADDVKYLQLIMEKQLDKIREEKLQLALDLDNAFVRVLAYIEYCGIYLNRDKWRVKMEGDKQRKAEAIEILNEWILTNLPDSPFIKTQLSLFSEAEVNIKWSSSKQVVPLMKHLGVDTRVFVNGKAKDSVDAKVISKQKHKSPFIELYLNFKAAEKVVSTYGETFIKQINANTGRIHTKFTQIMATGRLSSGGKDRANKLDYINLQNIPSDTVTRACFEGQGNNVLIDADYSGQEQILLVNHSQDEQLLDFYRSGKSDMHSFVTQKIAEVSSLYPDEILQCTEKEIKEQWEQYRTWSKSVGFCVNYGGQGATVADTLGITVKEGEAIYDAYFQAFPGLKKYFERAQAYVLKFGHVFFNRITGRKSYIPYFEEFREMKEEVDAPGFWDLYFSEKAANSAAYQTELKDLVRRYYKKKGDIERVALNYPIQGSSADVTKIAGVLFFQELERRGLLFEVLIPNIVHDEILVECDGTNEEFSEEMARLLKHSMEEAGKPFCPLVPLKATPIIDKVWKH